MAEILGFTPEMAACRCSTWSTSRAAQAARNLERRRQGSATSSSARSSARTELRLGAAQRQPAARQRRELPGSLCMISDISRRKRIEDVLSHREQQLAEAQRVAGVGSFEWDVVARPRAGPTGCTACWGEPQSLDGTGPTPTTFRPSSTPTRRGAQRVRDPDRSLMDGADLYETEYRIVRRAARCSGCGRGRRITRDDAASRPHAGHRARRQRLEARRGGPARDDGPVRACSRPWRRRPTRRRAWRRSSRLRSGDLRAHRLAGRARLPPAGATADAVVPLSIWHLAMPTPLAPARAGAAVSTRRPRSAGPRLMPPAPRHGPATSDPSGNRSRSRAADPGLRGAFAFPVCIGTEVTCILEFFSRAPIEPDASSWRRSTRSAPSSAGSPSASGPATSWPRPGTRRWSPRASSRSSSRP